MDEAYSSQKCNFGHSKHQHFACIQGMKLQSATLGTCQAEKTCGKKRWEWLGISCALAHAVQLKKGCIGKLRAQFTV